MGYFVTHRREQGKMRVRGASGAARVAQGGVDGMHGCMARLRRACRCAARGFGHARGREARAVGTTHLRGSGGRALDDGWSTPVTWWPRRSRPIHAERADPPKSASNGSKFISTKSQTCAKGATTESRGMCQCAKTVVSQQSSSCMVHLCASHSRSPVPDTPRKFPATLHAPSDTRGHGRWITTTGAWWRDGLRAMR